MADEAPDRKSSEAPEGVFGNLPAARPGTRSPRRGTSGKDEKADEARAPAKEKRAIKPPPPPPPPAPAEPSPAPSAKTDAPETGKRRSSAEQINSIEDLAWAGVAVAAQAATVGVKLASRALEAARKSVERPD